MANLAPVTIDQKELRQIRKDLQKLFPSSDTQLRTALRGALRKAARPLVPEIRKNIDLGLTSPALLKVKKREQSTGQLKKSIGIINGKVSRGRRPAVYIGPRVTKSFSDKEKSGFYFYFLEYGKQGVSPRRMLDAAANSKGGQVMNDVISKLKVIISKRWAKKLQEIRE